MNKPQFKIYGTARRETKKKLSLLKSFLKNYWHYHQLDKDMASFYCSGDDNCDPLDGSSYPMNDDIAKQKFDKANKELKILEEQLSVPYGA